MYSSKIRMRDSLRSPFPSVKTRPQALFLGFPNVKARPQALFFICKRQNQAAMLFSGFPNILTWPQSLFFGFPSVTTRPQALFGGGEEQNIMASGAGAAVGDEVMAADAAAIRKFLTRFNKDGLVDVAAAMGVELSATEKQLQKGKRFEIPWNEHTHIMHIHPLSSS